MRPSDITPLPAEHRFRSDVVALCVGPIAAAVAPFLLRYSHAGQWTGMLILLLIVSLALAASAAAVTYINRADVPSADTTYLIRAGARAGLLTAALAAAMTVLSVRISNSQLAAFFVLMPAALSILPGSFFGMLATAFAVGTLKPMGVPSESPSKSSMPSKMRLVILLVLVCIIGFASVLIPPGFWESVQTKNLVTNFPTSEWHYAKPPELGSVDAARWELLTTRMIGHVRENSPIALSQLGDRLAFVDGDQANVLKVVNLDHPDKPSAFSISGILIALAFAPDGSQIFFHKQESGHYVGVVDLTKARVIMLPRPKGAAVPSGDIIWPRSTEAVFQNGGRVFDLDMLELSESRNTTASSTQFSLPVTEHVSFQTQRVISSIDDPTDTKQKRWPLSGDTRLSIKDEPHDYRRFFPIDHQPGDWFFGSSDGTKIIRIRNNTILAYYFGLRAKTPVTFTVEMSTRPDEHPDKDRITTALSSGELCALIYAPLVNPLNDKVVGPDRDRVKGILRFASWNELNAAVWLTEEFQPVALNDVIADLHVWKNNLPELVVDSGSKRWWTKVSTIMPQQLEIAAVPARSNTKSLQRNLPQEHVTDSTIVKAAVVSTPPPPEPQVIQTPVRQPVAIRPPVPAEEIRPLSPDEPAFQYVMAFIQVHHQKANSGDLNALIADYGESVVFFDKGTVDKAYIWRNETMSRGPFRQMSESIIYPLSIEQHPPNQFAAEYKINWEAIKKDGRRSNGISNVYLVLEQTPIGLRIIRHQSKLELGE